MSSILPQRLEQAWWRKALQGFSTDAMPWLRSRYPSLREHHDDVLGDTLLQLTSQLTNRQTDYPISWFRNGQPSEDEARRFHGLAFAVLRMRVTDRFRSRYRDWMQSIEDIPEESWPVSTAMDAASALDLSRAASALLAAIGSLAYDDRLLIERAIHGETLPPLSGRDRERLSQIRKKLLRQLTTLLGTHPMELINRL